MAALVCHEADELKDGFTAGMHRDLGTYLPAMEKQLSILDALYDEYGLESDEVVWQRQWIELTAHGAYCCFRIVILSLDNQAPFVKGSVGRGLLKPPNRSVVINVPLAGSNTNAKSFPCKA